MVAQYNAEQKAVKMDPCGFRIESTSSLLALRLQAAVSHLNSRHTSHDVAYLHGRFDLGVLCAGLFGLGLEWHTLPECVEMTLFRIEHTNEMSTQLNNPMFGYTFRRKLLLVESLTRVSYQYEDRTVSYERMKPLGDALLMVVADLLYKYPGKAYPPHDIHIRKSAVVNIHFLAYIYLRTSLDVDASMPGLGPCGNIVIQSRTKLNVISRSVCLTRSETSIGR